MRYGGFWALAFAGVVAAQPKFEVASVRRVSPPVSISRPFDFSPVLPGGQYIDACASLPLLIEFAYDIKDLPRQLIGLPDSAARELYSIAAKASADFHSTSAADNREKVRLMMRELLAERFHLVMHQETRIQPVLRLRSLAGSKLKEVPPPEPPRKSRPVTARLNDRGGRIEGMTSTMPGLAEALTAVLSQPVIDETALTGYYDFDLRWSAPEGTDDDSQILGTAGIALMVVNLRERLGLRLIKSTGPVEYWIVDHVEPPTEN